MKKEKEKEKPATKIVSKTSIEAAKAAREKIVAENQIVKK